MTNDKQVHKQMLEKLNTEIGDAESQGNDEARGWLARVIAPKLAFQRADRTTIDDREKFLEKVKPGPPRKTIIESIDLYGNRAIVKCIVGMGDRRFHNIRLFVWIGGQEGQGGEWKLLGWANEPL
jgi:hypothetical protein